jgi:hypothetical protein
MGRDILVYEPAQSLCVPGLVPVDCSPKNLSDLGFTPYDFKKAEAKSTTFSSSEWIQDKANGNKDDWVYHVSIVDKARDENIDLRIFIKMIKIKDKKYDFVKEIIENKKDITDSYVIYNTLRPFSVKRPTRIALL